MHASLEAIVSTTIEPMFLLDHVPTTITIRIGQHLQKPCHWPFNEDLLQDERLENDLETEFSFFFSTNLTPEILPMNILEAHKCVI